MIFFRSCFLNLFLFSQFSPPPDCSSPLDRARARVQRQSLREELKEQKSPSSVALDLTGETNLDRDEPRLELETQSGGIDSVIAVHDYIIESTPVLPPTASTVVSAPMSAQMPMIALPIAVSAPHSALSSASAPTSASNITASALPTIASPPAHLDADDSLHEKSKRSLDHSGSTSAAKKRK